MAGGAAIDSFGELPREGERLDIEANLGVDIDGRTFAVRSEENRIVVQAPSVGACVALVSGERRRLLELAALLEETGVTVEVRTGEAVLAVVGTEASPGGVAAALAAGAVELRPDGVLTGLLRLR